MEIYCCLFDAYQAAFLWIKFLKMHENISQMLTF